MRKPLGAQSLDARNSGEEERRSNNLKAPDVSKQRAVLRSSVELHDTAVQAEEIHYQ